MELDSEVTLFAKLVGYALILIPLILQASFLHPYHRNNKEATLVRRVLVPVIVFTAFATVPMRKWYPLSDSMMVNFCFVSLATFHTACLGLQNGFYDGPVLKEEVEPKIKTKDQSRSSEPMEHSQGDLTKTRVTESEKPNSECTSHAQDNRPDQAESTSWSLTRPTAGELFRFAVWLVFSPRGLEFHWAPPSSVTKLRDPISRKQFIYENIWHMTVMQIYGTIYWSILTYTFSQPNRFYGVLTDCIGLPRSHILSYLSDYGLTFFLVGSMWSAVEIAGCGMNIIEFLFYPLLRIVLPGDWAPKEFNPRRYPPLFSKPWHRTSMLDFWGKGWHAIFRRDLVYCGALPAIRIASSLGLGPQSQNALGLMGAMFLTAVMHEYAIASISSSKWGLQIFFFFMKCGLVMLFEKFVENNTNHKVQGRFGRIWTYSWLMLFAKPAFNLWIERGLGQKLIPITQWSLSQVLFPAGFALPQRWFNWLPF